MALHDFRYTLLSPQHTLTECRALVPGRYQVTGNGGAIQNGDTLLVTLKGSKTLSMRLTVETVRHLINPRGQWVAVASGPVFNELEILTWQVECDQCDAVLEQEGEWNDRAEAFADICVVCAQCYCQSRERNWHEDEQALHALIGSLESVLGALALERALTEAVDGGDGQLVDAS